MPKLKSVIATTAKGSAGSQMGTRRIPENQIIATSAHAPATPKNIPNAKRGRLRQAMLHKTIKINEPTIATDCIIAGLT